MSEMQQLGLADLKALIKQASEAVKSLAAVRAEEFAEVIRPAVEDIILTQGEPNVSATSGATGWPEKCTIMVDGVEYAVTMWLSPVKLNEANRKAYAESPEGKKKAAEREAAKAKA